MVQGRFLTLGFFTSVGQWLKASALVGSVAVVLLAVWLYSNITEGRKRRRYQRALEDVAKMQ